MKILFGNLNRIATICDLLSLGKLIRPNFERFQFQQFQIALSKLEKNDENCKNLHEF